jgi:alpha,alpha-trehalose phosphorylase
VLDIPPPPKSDPVTQPKGCEPRRRMRAGSRPEEHPSTKDSARLR